MSPRAAALAMIAALVLGPGAAAAADDTRRRPWYAPDQLKLQLAGNIGFLSPGAGYAWLGRRLEGDLFFGWVPRAVGSDDIVSFTGKLTWLPWEVALRPGWHVRPVTAALQLTYTLGDEYFVFLPDRYPDDYYDFPTALRAGLAIGGTVARRGRGIAREVGGYWELVALDVVLLNWIRNTRALGPEDLFSLALGVRVAF